MNIEAILKAQGQKLRFAKLAGQKAVGLAPKLGNALIEHLSVMLVVYIHNWRFFACCWSEFIVGEGIKSVIKNKKDPLV